MNSDGPPLPFHKAIRIVRKVRSRLSVSQLAGEPLDAVDIDAPALEVAALKVGDRVPMTIDALGGERIDGRIRRIFPSADSATRLVPVEIALSGDLRGRLRPGYSVRATFALDRRENALLVPSRALSGPSGSRTLFIVKEGKIARRAVRVGDRASVR